MPEEQQILPIEKLAVVVDYLYACREDGTHFFIVNGEIIYLYEEKDIWDAMVILVNSPLHTQENRFKRAKDFLEKRESRLQKTSTETA